MSSNYTGNAGNLQLPSPAPAPGVSPTVVLPSDGDAANAASVAQAMKVPADFIAHIQAAARLDVPVVPGLGGFTNVVSSGLGTGVIGVDPNSVKMNTGTRFVIQIQTGGAVGVATFKTSMDGGNTYGATQITAASMIDATSGIELTFVNTFTAGGTASFRSAYTPLAQWNDAAGKSRFVIDHNGFPTGGGVSVFREQWPYIVDPLAAPQTQVVWTGTPWTYDIPAGGLIQQWGATDLYNARYVELKATTSVGASTVLWGPLLLYPNTPGMSCVFEVDFGMNPPAAGPSSKASSFLGLQDGQDGPNTNSNVIALYKGHSSTAWQMYNAGGGVPTLGLTQAFPMSGFAPTDRYRIEIHGSASPLGAYQVRYFMNEIFIGSQTTTSFLPSTVAVRPVFAIYTEGGAPVGSPTIYVGAMQVTWNRFANGTGF